MLFGDLSDFTSWSEDLDPERVGAVTDRVLAALAGAVKTFGGHVDKLTGDGISVNARNLLAFDASGYAHQSRNNISQRCEHSYSASQLCTCTRFSTPICTRSCPLIIPRIPSMHSVLAAKVKTRPQR